jgi:hypothetical protein
MGLRILLLPDSHYLVAFKNGMAFNDSLKKSLGKTLWKKLSLKNLKKKEGDGWWC